MNVALRLLVGASIAHRFFDERTTFCLRDPQPCRSDSVLYGPDLTVRLQTGRSQRRPLHAYGDWVRRSEIRPGRRSESDPPEGRSFYASSSDLSSRAA